MRVLAEEAGRTGLFETTTEDIYTGNGRDGGARDDADQDVRSAWFSM